MLYPKDTVSFYKACGARIMKELLFFQDINQFLVRIVTKNQYTVQILIQIEQLLFNL
jgi:hypothetical protein